jgi:hypothetical protein
MSGSRPHPCYLCGKPCWNKGCMDCLRRGKNSGLGKRNSRVKRRKAELMRREGLFIQEGESS